MDAYIYMLYESDLGLIKIGKSRNPRERLKALRQYYSFNTVASFVIKVRTQERAYELENMFHRLFSGSRVKQHGPGGTEFFKPGVLSDIINVADILATQEDVKVIYDYFTTDDFMWDEISITKVKNVLAAMCQKVRSLRLNKDISRSFLAKISGVHSSSIKRLEHNGNATLLTLIKLLVVLGDKSIENILNNVKPTVRQRGGRSTTLHKTETK